VSLNDGLPQSLRLFHEGGGVVLPVKEVHGGERLVDKCSPSSFYVTMLVIICLALDLSQGHLQSSGS
jgi:hypothetical protein